MAPLERFWASRLRVVHILIENGAPAVAARTPQVSVWTRLMSAAHSSAQRNEFNVHLESAGDRFGAMAHGGWRRRISGVAEKWGTVSCK